MPLTPSEAILNTETISIYREPSSTAAGAQDEYSGLQRSQTLPPAIYEDIACSIQAQRSGGTNPPKLPSDTKRSDWFIYIPAGVAPPKGGIRQGDLVVDEFGSRYTVNADYWTSLGWRLHVSKEEA